VIDYAYPLAAKRLGTLFAKPFVTFVFRHFSAQVGSQGIFSARRVPEL
jgi:hypothetical protein